MIVGIAGNMDFFDIRVMRQAIEDCRYPIDKIITMDYHGVCTMAVEVAMARRIPFEVLIPDWDNLDVENVEIRRRPKNHPQAGQKYNHRAGINLNTTFVEKCDAFIILWDGKGRGTLDVIGKIGDTKPSWAVRIQP